MQPTDLVDNLSKRDDIPEFAPGDTLKVHVRVIEGNRERTQVFEGVVIRQGSGLQETYTVRKLSFGVGVERTFPVHTPIVERVEFVSRGDVRRRSSTTCATASGRPPDQESATTDRARRWADAVTPCLGSGYGHLRQIQGCPRAMGRAA